MGQVLKTDEFDLPYNLSLEDHMSEMTKAKEKILVYEPVAEAPD